MTQPATPSSGRHINGNKWMIIITALLSLIGGLLTILVIIQNGRVSALEDTWNKAVETGRMETPEQKTFRIDSRFQYFYANTIKPDLLEIKQLLKEHKVEKSGG